MINELDTPTSPPLPNLPVKLLANKLTYLRDNIPELSSLRDYEHEILPALKQAKDYLQPFCTKRLGSQISFLEQNVLKQFADTITEFARARLGKKEFEFLQQLVMVRFVIGGKALQTEKTEGILESFKNEFLQLPGNDTPILGKVYTELTFVATAFAKFAEGKVEISAKSPRRE